MSNDSGGTYVYMAPDPGPYAAGRGRLAEREEQQGDELHGGHRQQDPQPEQEHPDRGTGGEADEVRQMDGVREERSGPQRASEHRGQHQLARTRERPLEPGQDSLRNVVLTRPFERVSLELVHPVVGLAHPDAPYLDLLSFILGNGDSSRLVRRVKERDGHAERIDASSGDTRLRVQRAALLKQGGLGVAARHDREHARTGP